MRHPLNTRDRRRRCCPGRGNWQRWRRDEPDSHARTENLLDRLLYKGVLPRYAFLTDVVSFYVFDRDRSTRFRPEFTIRPQVRASAAISQYAPGKEMWIDGNSGRRALCLYADAEDRYEAWEDRKLVPGVPDLSLRHNCRPRRGRIAGEVCEPMVRQNTSARPRTGSGRPDSAYLMSWEGRSLDDQPARSYATRAKLMASGPADV